MNTVSRALVSVFDKSGIVDFARGLQSHGIEILSTGGTLRELEANDIAVTPVSEVTGFPEILGGRVKTLHPRIHGGILADRSKPDHLDELSSHEIEPIDLVAVNLYPFSETAADATANFEDVIEMIDIGGPSMIRAAAKNHQGVLVVVDPSDYPAILDMLTSDDESALTHRRRELALKAFRHTAAYDRAIEGWLAEQIDGRQPGQTDEPDDLFPTTTEIALTRELRTRYGENPHQQAALYCIAGREGVFGGFEQHQGKELSFNNLLDTDAARRLVALFDEPAVVIVKHNNPCGVGCGTDTREAYKRALECDPVSAFGSIVACNRVVDTAAAEAMRELFIEVVVAPQIAPEALEIFAQKSNLRVLQAPLFQPSRQNVDMRSVDGGMLMQTEDSAPVSSDTWTVASARQPTDSELSALGLTWRVVRQVKSNAIVIGNALQTVGIGAGQMSRVDACRLAVEKAQLETAGCVAASDAFFPFPDGLEVLADAGITAVVQPGGSKRDSEVIAAADARDIALVMTGQRHFRH